ncbi:MAG: Modification methylase PaeR7I [Verrucomicrobia subdivision 3 bacterium]|nr:Modification methylase PaeR7I [Limisphaerales bacterium]
MNNDLNQLRTALQKLRHSDFRDGHLALLKTLGYQSTRTLPIPNADPKRFKEWVEEKAQQKLDENKAKFSDWHHADLLFQLTGEELQGASGQEVEPGLMQSYVFFALGLKINSYSRTDLATITRQINRLFPMPVMVLYTYGGLLSIAVINRRPHKRDRDRDVLEKVTLIKDIRLEAPHRAHLDILSQLYLPELTDKDGAPVKNFDALHQAWESVFNVEPLNKHFYQELYQWFERAGKESTFPDDRKGEGSEKRQVIRLITRLLFIWFLKEKGLVAEELFNEEEISKLLKNYDRNEGGSYYRAVLQNLFFATLNTEMDKRDFSEVTNKTHRDFSRYRFKKEMTEPEKLRDLFKKTPFINGGLFDCLDSFEGSREGGDRIDCFTDNVIDPRRTEYGKLSVPNRLFFDHHGLLPLLNRYKFTVEENTPIEQEVALDPELLGKVFENLLATYNPETRETARKQTGSYYTPRPIVDYMVDEALIASLSEQAEPTNDDTNSWRKRLRYLLDYENVFDDAAELFDLDETKRLVGAIARLKILDPAVGSGAFPMSVLHKLTLALKRLDPDNKYWERLQKDRAKEKADAAFETRDQKERDAELQEISKTFEQYRNSDFGRKLYLIQNSIHGVDIQPIACQIAKLRFFISLAIEQKPEAKDKNLGIRPLPNLETKFVAADTLLSLEAPPQLELFRQDIEAAETKLVENREQYFHATTREEKRDCKDRDKEIRTELSEALQNAKLPEEDANKIAQWDPYDQNAKADWFDAEYMFGVKDGFDMVMGNPPYIQLQKSGGKLGALYQPAGYNTFIKSGDIYVLFYECGMELLKKDGGHLCFITSNSWLKAKYGGKLRHYFSENHAPLKLLDMGKDIFKNTIVDSSILLAKTGKSDTVGKTVDLDRLPGQPFPPDENLWGELRIEESQPWMALSAVERSIMDKMQALGTPLKEWDIPFIEEYSPG